LAELKRGDIREAQQNARSSFQQHMEGQTKAASTWTRKSYQNGTSVPSLLLRHLKKIDNAT